MTSKIIFFLLAFTAQVTAQSGIVALARYDGKGKPTLTAAPTLPEFQGSFTALQDSFQRLYDYNNRVIAQTIMSSKPREGIVGFSVDSIGQLFDFQLIDSTYPIIDKEVIRTLSKLKGFHTAATTRRFSVAYDLFPDWRWQEEEQQQAYEKERARRKIIAETPAEELEQYVDPTRRVWGGALWLGQTTTTPRLTSFLRNMGQFGIVIERTRKKWYASGHFQIRWGSLRRDFQAKDYFWQRDTGITIVGIGLNFGRQIINSKKFTLTTYVGFDVQGLSVESGNSEDPDYSPTLTSALPSAGLLLDYKFQQKGDHSWNSTTLNTAILRFRLSVNAANFGKPRQGALIDLGIGIGGYQRAIKK